MKRRRRSRRGKMSKSSPLKDKMTRVILRGRGETLGDALKAAKLSTATYYYYVRTAQWGSVRRGKERKVSLSAVEARRLIALIKRQGRISADLQKFTKLVSR